MHQALDGQEQDSEKRQPWSVNRLLSLKHKMKKIVMVSLLVWTMFSLYAKVHAADTTMMNAVFKIQGYAYDNISDMYVLKQYGSAVLVADNMLLTNAHVVTDNNDAFTLQYEACQTISDQEPPKCFSTLQLMKYDKNSDLALLQIVNPSSNMPDPVTIWSGRLAVGSNISIIGYPANGGQTITTTQWTIAWFENNYYKTDANVDEGNSWWWSFDSAGEFIGIPTFVVNGQTTLWYIIPTDTIKSFLAWSIGTTYKVKYATAFDKWLKSTYVQQEKTTVDNPLFTTPDYSVLGLNLDLIVEKKANNLYNYSFKNANDSIVDMISLIATDNVAVTRYISSVMKQLKESQLNPTKSTKKIGNTSWTVIMFWDADWIGYDYIQTSSNNKTYLEFTVLVDKEDIKSDLADLLAFVEDTTIKKSSIKPQPFNIPIIKLSSKRDISIVKWIRNEGLTINIFPVNGKYAADVHIDIWEKWDTLRSFTKQFLEYYDGLWYTTKSETSKYPTKASVFSVIDENDTMSVNILGLKKNWSNTVFIHVSAQLTSESTKQEVVTLAYKIFGLE